MHSPTYHNIDVTEHIRFVRQNSPYYKDHYAGVAEEKAGIMVKLQDYPLVDHSMFWQANTCQNSQVLTAPQADGIIFKTGGTLHHVL